MQSEHTQQDSSLEPVMIWLSGKHVTHCQVLHIFSHGSIFQFASQVSASFCTDFHTPGGGQAKAGPGQATIPDLCSVYLLEWSGVVWENICLGGGRSERGEQMTKTVEARLDLGMNVLGSRPPGFGAPKVVRP